MGKKSHIHQIHWQIHTEHQLQRQCSLSKLLWRGFESLGSICWDLRVCETQVVDPLTLKLNEQRNKEAKQTMQKTGQHTIWSVSTLTDICVFSCWSYWCRTCSCCFCCCCCSFFRCCFGWFFSGFRFNSGEIIKISTAERVPSECSLLRYTSNILEYLFKSTAKWVPSGCDKVRYTCNIFLWLHKAFCCHASRVEVDCGMIEIAEW